jgi:glucosamine 6-phosphate synthetase-like amidotransferase/phosphosugar isomerase protein
MCGIVGAVAERNVVPILVEGLRRLEYRGYDSAGLAVLNGSNAITRVRTPGKVAALDELLEDGSVHGSIGIAHTRWATHGVPNEANAHPHVCRDEVAVVHNGIIENYSEIRAEQERLGYEFQSDTDTEVIAARIHHYLSQGADLVEAVRSATSELEGAYAIGVVNARAPDRVVGARMGPPLLVGLGVGEHFLTSDVAALVPVTQRFLILEDGDIAELQRDHVTVYDHSGQVVEREETLSELDADAVERGQYRHYMQKEIFEQPESIANTLEGRLHGNRVLEESFGPEAKAIFDRVKSVQIVAWSPVVRAFMRAWLLETGSKDSPASHVMWRLRASSATGIQSPMPMPWWWQSRNQVRRRTPSRPPRGRAGHAGNRFRAGLEHRQRSGEFPRSRIRAGAHDPCRSGDRCCIHEGVYDTTHRAVAARVCPRAASRLERGGRSTHRRAAADFTRIV